MEPPEAPINPTALVSQACHEPFRAAWADLEEHFTQGIIRRLEAGLLAHRTVCEEIGLKEDLPSEWEPAADGLLEYRKVISNELLEPLRAFFGTPGPSRRIVDRIGAAVTEATEAIGDLPATVVAPWPTGALDRKPSDRLRRRIGKVLARGVSGARKAGKERKVPCRQVGRQHLAGVVVPQEDRALVNCLVSWSEWARQLELAWVGWTDDALPALVQFEAPDDEQLAEQWIAIREAALELEARLEALIEGAPLAVCLDEGSSRSAAWRTLLDADLGVAGSFLLRAPESSVMTPTLKRALRVAPPLSAWDEGVAARMGLNVALLAILSGATGAQRRLSYRFREQCLTPSQSLRPIADSLERLSTEVREVTATRLDDLRSRVGSLLEPAAEAVPTAAVVHGTVAKGSDGTVEALLAMVRQAPASFELHAENAKPPTGTRTAETRSVPFQELARQSFDALRIERIRSSTEGLLTVVDEVRENVSGLAEVFAFADEAAVLELEGEEAEAETRARELVRAALNSMAESLRHEVADLEAGAASAQTRLASEISEGSLGLLDRIAAGRMQAQLLAARSRVADLRVRLNQSWGPPVDRAARWVIYRWHVLQRLASRSFRKGTEMVGGGSGERSESTRAIKTLADSGEVTDRLPLVYQRLFTLDALSDPALVASRSSELGAAMTRWRSWRSGDGVPIVVRGRQGSGVSSALNMFCASIEASQGRVARVPLLDRLREEGPLTRLLAESLELPVSDTLAELAHTIFKAEPTALPDVVAVDNLEHLFLRVPGGTDLIERLLTLMAETEPRIFWIGGITTSAWQIVETGEPTAVSQVDALEMPPLGAAGIREAMMLRHKRSGLPIRYEESKTGRRMLRRRIARMRNPEADRALIEVDFFDQMYRSSSGNLRLALFQWQQAADFSAGEGLLMRPPEKPNFSVLDTLDLTQNFTLKAFLEHRTLTLAEHDQIFRLPRLESYQIFESLGNRHLITTVEAGDDPDGSEAQVNLRYQVQPLLVGAVISHLESRNIVH